MSAEENDLMENIVNVVCLSIILIIEMAAYIILVGVFMPKWIVRIRCVVKESFDRGIKKYTFPSGRGVVYEPHPSIRKYINRYTLFTNDGYKYIKCRVDSGVKKLNYSVVMFDNRNKVIDVLDINEIKPRNCETDTVAIHQDTSYVSLVLNSVNGEMLEGRPIVCCAFGKIIAYGAAVAALSFAQVILMYGMINVYIDLLFKNVEFLVLNVTDFVLPSLVIGFFAGVASYLYTRHKGVRWSK